MALVSPNTGLGLEMEIKRLYVLHRFHQRGLGRRLMNEILATARQDGIAELFQKFHERNPGKEARPAGNPLSQRTVRLLVAIVGPNHEEDAGGGPTKPPFRSMTCAADSPQ